MGRNAYLDPIYPQQIGRVVGLAGGAKWVNSENSTGDQASCCLLPSQHCRLPDRAGGAAIASDWVADLGLQESPESVDPVIVEVNRAIGLADVTIPVPIFMVAVVGLWKLRCFGAVAAWLASGSNSYWTIVAWVK